MADMILCKLCHNRRAKRACPAVNGEICAICCGEQREVTLSCPLDCGFLREAHKHEKTLQIPADQIANSEIEISEEDLRTHEELLLFCIYSLMQAALRTPHAVDTDVLEALDALIKTRHTARSGLIYESRPDNMIAAGLQERFTESLEGYADERQEREPFSPHIDADVFRILIFLRRVGQQNLNGRPKGRMFIDMLRNMTPDVGVDERAPSIII